MVISTWVKRRDGQAFRWLAIEQRGLFLATPRVCRVGERSYRVLAARVIRDVTRSRAGLLGVCIHLDEGQEVPAIGARAELF